MYRGFNLVIPETLNDSFTEKGKEIHSEMTEKINDRFDDLIAFNGIINGNKVIEKWFPIIECDIFLSHSHKDQDKAIALAGLLYKNFGLKTFIDSTVWGFSDKLLKAIDDKYCMHENQTTYSYEKRNFSTSHVHLMLNSALNKMIDSCEAIFFLNTPNSVSAIDTIKDSTNSPWIFSEIATTQTIRKKTPKRLKQETRTFSSRISLSESVKEQLTVEYELELSHFTKLTLRDIQLWINKAKFSNSNPLDELYSLNQINSKFLIDG
ncbi:hypothetical protein LPB303_06540 [Polaribacter atrinae]|uniref:TIR domain-containing protein n=2 Tax=Polaribacter atrinae TaxID=1333662 RepID=A0A176TDI3_9FLAO|nr:hypothetical protein LPB303_06540 [Polaribacter atrinae]